ncbi:hypothetical protein [Robertmurraya sp. Marseille-Q9965]
MNFIETHKRRIEQPQIDRLEQERQRDIQRYQYDCKFNAEKDKFIPRLYDHFKQLPLECRSQIKLQTCVHKFGYFREISVQYKNIGRRYRMDSEGNWFELPDLHSYFTILGYPINDDTLESFAVDIKRKYYIERNEVNE